MTLHCFAALRGSTRILLYLTTFTFVSTVGCDDDTSSDGDADGDVDDDVATDADADADSDTDTDIDGDADTDVDADGDEDEDGDGDGDVERDAEADADEEVEPECVFCEGRPVPGCCPGRWTCPDDECVFECDNGAVPPLIWDIDEIEDATTLEAKLTRE